MNWKKQITQEFLTKTKNAYEYIVSVTGPAAESYYVSDMDMKCFMEKKVYDDVDYEEITFIAKYKSINGT